MATQLTPLGRALVMVWGLTIVGSTVYRYGLLDTLVPRATYGKGQAVPGARVVATYHVIEGGVAWREDLTRTREHADLLAEVRERFRTP